MFYWTDSMYTVPNGGPQNPQNGSLDKYGMDPRFSWIRGFLHFKLNLGIPICFVYHFKYLFRRCLYDVSYWHLPVTKQRPFEKLLTQFLICSMIHIIAAEDK